jgi:hypothetical protein
VSFLESDLKKVPVIDYEQEMISDSDLVSN